MKELRLPVGTVGFIDSYSDRYRSVFGDVRNFESFKQLHVGILSELPRKTLPEIAKLVGLKDGQSLHHFLRDGTWSVGQVRERRLEATRQQMGERAMTLCIDETGDAKKGTTTDYVARQYIGKLGKTDNGIVSVNAYGVVDGITYPLLFKVFKPQSRLKAGDEYKTKPQLAVEIIEEVKALGFNIAQVVADSLYGESSTFLGALATMKLPFIVAIRSNHGVWLSPEQEVYSEAWTSYDQPLAEKPTERRYIREIIFGERRSTRYYEITKGSTEDPKQADTWQIMTNLSGEIQSQVALLYTLRTWIEYSFKQVKHELGWSDYRLTDYQSIERWWELVMSAYFLVSLQADTFKTQAQSSTDLPAEEPRQPTPFEAHRHWQRGETWKSALNNLRLLLQPYCCWGWLEPWLDVFPIPGLKRGFSRLMDWIDTFQSASIPEARAA
jgi:SRSO17 transposase